MKKPCAAAKKPCAAAKTAPLMMRPAAAEKQLTPKEIVAETAAWDPELVAGKKRKYWTDKCYGKAQKLAEKHKYDEEKCREIGRMAHKKGGDDFDANVG